MANKKNIKSKQTKKGNYAKLFILISLFIAGFFFIKSASNLDIMTAIVGQSVIDLNVIYGTVFLVVGLATVHFFYRRKIKK